MTTPAAAEPEGSVSRHAPAKDTYVFDISEARRGAAINRLCASFKDERNRQDFLADEEATGDYGSRHAVTEHR